MYHARKKSGLSPENVAEKLGVSRQTISKWETGETLPDIRQSKRLAVLYHITLDELAEYDFDEQQAREMIDSVSEEARLEQGVEQKVPGAGHLPQNGAHRGLHHRQRADPAGAGSPAHGISPKTGPPGPRLCAAGSGGLFLPRNGRCMAGFAHPQPPVDKLPSGLGGG